MPAIGTHPLHLPNESSLGRLSDLLEQLQRDDHVRRMLASLSGGLQHELNSPLGALISAADTLGRVLERFHRSLAVAEAGDDAQRAEVFADVAQSLAALGTLCAVFDESAQRIDEVVRGLRHLEPQLERAEDLAELQAVLRLVEHDGRVRFGAAADSAASSRHGDLRGRASAPASTPLREHVSSQVTPWRMPS